MAGQSGGSLFVKLRNYIRHPFYRWATIGDFFIEGFLSQAGDDRDKRFFNDDLLARIEAKSVDGRTLYWRLYFFNLAVLLFLIAGVFKVKLHISIPVIDFDPDSVAREILLFATATVAMINSFVYLRADLMGKAALKLRLAKVPTGYGLAMIDRLNGFDFFAQLCRTYIEANSPAVKAGGFGAVLKIILVMFVLAVLHLTMMTTVTIILHILVMIDIWTTPSLPNNWSHAIVLYSLALDVVTLTLSIIISFLPLRYPDRKVMATYARLSQQSDGAAAAYVDDLVRAASSNTVKQRAR